MSVEYLDAYRIDGSKTEETLIRGKEIKNGLFYLASEVLVVFNRAEVLFVQRHPNKKGYPNYFEATATGAALKGETSKQAAYRELLEETGIACPNLIYNHRWINESSQIIFDSYIAPINSDKRPTVELQVTEAVDYRWVALEDISTFARNNKVIDRQIKLIQKLTRG